MSAEERYDAEIAPLLLEIAKRCERLGFPMIASVEWSKGDNGRTEFYPKREGDTEPASAKQLLIHYASRCNGNIDSMLFAVMKDAEKHGHTSACLRILGVNETPK